MFIELHLEEPPPQTPPYPSLQRRMGVRTCSIASLGGFQPSVRRGRHRRGNVGRRVGDVPEHLCANQPVSRVRLKRYGPQRHAIELASREKCSDSLIHALPNTVVTGQFKPSL